MATYTSIINSVLRRMRESEVAGPASTSYAALVGDFVNETKREVEDTWKWTSLRQQIPISTVSGEDTVTITGAGERFKLQDAQFSVYDSTSKAYLTKQNSVYLTLALADDATLGVPEHYIFEGIDASDDPIVKLYRTPDGVYVLNFNLIVPQADFTVGTEVVKAPHFPIYLGAVAKAIAERGEDNGQTSGEAQARYQLALSDAIAMDESRTTDETTWYV